jgi:hypothetical protein
LRPTKRLAVAMAETATVVPLFMRGGGQELSK